MLFYNTEEHCSLKQSVDKYYVQFKQRFVQLWSNGKDVISQSYKFQINTVFRMFRIVLLAAIQLAFVTAKCPTGWTNLPGSLKCYKGFAERKTFAEADTYCRENFATNAGSLVSVHNAPQNTHLFGKYSFLKMLIGLANLTIIAFKLH